MIRKCLLRIDKRLSRRLNDENLMGTEVIQNLFAVTPFVLSLAVTGRVPKWNIPQSSKTSVNKLRLMRPMQIEVEYLRRAFQESGRIVTELSMLEFENNEPLFQARIYFMSPGKDSPCKAGVIGEIELSGIRTLNFLEF